MPSYEELLQGCMKELETKTNITQLGPGSKARTLLEIVNARLAASYHYFDTQLAQAFLSTAQGQYLDLIGDLLACPRRQAQTAEVDAEEENLCFYVDQGTFGDLNNGNPISIPVGTTISSAPLGDNKHLPVVYRLWEEVTLPANAQRTFVSASADLPGTYGNVGRQQLRYHSLATFPGLQVTNLESIANGVDIEDDESYRQRLRQQIFTVAAANVTAIRLACLSVPGVADAIVHLYARGAGTLDVYITATYGLPNNTLLQQVQLILNQQQALGVRAIARAPILLGISFSTTATVSKTLNIQEQQNIILQLTRRAEEYFRMFSIGQTFTVNTFMAYLMQGIRGLLNLGTANRPFQELYLWRSSPYTNKRNRYVLQSDYQPAFNEWIQLESQPDFTAADFKLQVA